MDEKKKRELFLGELQRVTNKYGLIVDGCGCCSPPFLIEIAKDPSDFFGEGKYTLNDEGEISWESFQHE